MNINKATSRPIVPFVWIGILIVLICAYLFISPQTSAPDELAHLAYPRYIMLENNLPSFQTPQDAWESHQPPLYYLVSLPFFLSSTHTSIELQFFIQRLTSLFFFILSVLFLYKLAKQLYSFSSFSQTLFLLPLGLPMVLYSSASFSNDITLLFAGSLLVFLFYNKYKLTNDAHAILLGLLFGLVLLTKYHIYPLLFIAGLFILWEKTLRFWVITLITTLLTAGWWFAHNLKEVGDILGLRNTFLLWESQRVDVFSFGAVINFITKLFASFVGVFGKLQISFPQILYASFGVGFLVLLVLFFKKKQGSHITILIFGALAIITLVCFQALHFYQPQGRYLLGIIPILGVMLANLFSRGSERNKFFLLTGGFVLLIGMSVWALSLIHSFYITNPIQTFTHGRNISLFEKNFVGIDYNTNNENKVLQINQPQTFYTLSDLRLDTQPNVTISFQTTNPKNTQVVVYWKILGMNAFSSKRSVTQTLESTATKFVLPEQNTSLLQDIQLQFSHVTEPFSISNITLSN